VVVAEPFLCQKRVGVLSVLDFNVRSRTSKHWTPA
jgi:hypothetical protein